MAWRRTISQCPILILMIIGYLTKSAESIRQCKHYPNPKNGQVVCDSLFRLFCTPECDEGFDFEFKPAVVYMCGPMTGEWFTYPKGEKIPWPHCVKRLSNKDIDLVTDEVARRRAQISKRMQDIHSFVSPQNKPRQIGQPDARYLRIFNYLQRAKQPHDSSQSLSDVKSQQGAS
ncbi:uncharacterized protein LOC141874150 [Acropora palmata]|uniref:uncharacterized protein LOC141874150 n=1 Tax=Acropora palmata TaxID=6131 RepID=UPI003DA1A80A